MGDASDEMIDQNDEDDEDEDDEDEDDEDQDDCVDASFRRVTMESISDASLTGEKTVVT